MLTRTHTHALKHNRTYIHTSIHVLCTHKNKHLYVINTIFVVHLVSVSNRTYGDGNGRCRTGTPLKLQHLTELAWCHNMDKLCLVVVERKL